MKKWWIFGADFFMVWRRFFHGLRRFFTVCKGHKRWKKKTSRYWWAFSRLVFHGLPPLEQFKWSKTHKNTEDKVGALLVQTLPFICCNLLSRYSEDLRSTDFFKIIFLWFRGFWGMVCLLRHAAFEPAKSKRGREEGDGTENVINCRDVCRKLS